MERSIFRFIYLFIHLFIFLFVGVFVYFAAFAPPYFTAGSLNADILRYNADIISATLKQTGWKCVLSQHFSISFSYITSFCPIKPSLSSAQYVSAYGSTMAFRAHGVISRERLPQMCDNTDTVRSAPIF